MTLVNKIQGKNLCLHALQVEKLLFIYEELVKIGYVAQK